MTDEELLVDAETRRRVKAAQTNITIPSKAGGEDLTAALSRLASLKAVERPPEHTEDSAKAKELLEASGVPKRHLGRLVDMHNERWSEKLGRVQGLLGSGFILALCGAQGRGKTQLAVEAIKTNSAKLKTSKFSTAMDFFIALKASYDPEERDSESGVITRFSKPRLLVLDEMDERGETEWENRLLFHMVNRRYNNMTDTILISRRTYPEFEQSIGKSIASRLMETGGHIDCDWESFRV